MRFNWLNPSWAWLVLFLALPAGAVENPQIEVEEIVLDNGMTWLLYENHDSPTVMAGWTALVGSVNERPGITGLSHFFEHMMFKGTHTIGTRDIEADLRIIEEQERVREEMRAEKAVMRARLRRGEIDDLANPESWTQRYRELSAEFDVLVQQQREIIVKDELDRIYTRNGGEFMNAGTSEDQTLYFIRIPSNRLELWAWLESDRLLNPVFREFYSERDVVFEERRMRTESTPLGKFDEAFNATFWEAHPYMWPVVGWASDIPMYTLAQAREYFATYYAPNNIIGVLAGDFEVAEVRPLLERYFGRIPRGEVDPPPVVTQEPEPVGEKRFNAEAETSPTVRIWWKGVPFVHRDMPVLDLLSDVMIGRTGRLYKGLVDGRKIANQVSAGDRRPEVRRHLHGRVHGEGRRGPGGGRGCGLRGDREAPERAGAGGGASEGQEPLQGLRLPTTLLAALHRNAAPQYAGLGDWRYINTSAERIEAVTAEDLQRAAKEYLTEGRRTVGIFLREEGAAPEDPEVAALDSTAQSMVRQALGQLEAVEDPAQLEQMIAQMQQAGGQAPPEMKPAIDLILKRAGERLEDPHHGCRRRCEVRIAMNRHALVALVLALTVGTVSAPAQEIPDHPDELTFEPIVFEPPSPEDHRHVLKNGMVVFIAEDRALPLVNISLTLPVGSWLDPEGKEGLASFTGSQMRRGGTKSLTAEELDERLDFLAAQVSTGIGATSGGASLNCLTDNLDEALALFVEMLREPRFQEDRLALAREQSLQAMKKRNDDSGDIEAREWNVLLNGEGHFTNRFTTEASLTAITRDDLVAFHRQHVHPSRMIAAVSGSFETADMLRRLEEAFADWPGTPAETPPIPDTIDPAAPGLYRIEKDVNQGRVSIGLPGVRRDHPDVYALELMVDILGRQRLHVAHHHDGALQRGPRLRRAGGDELRGVVPGTLPGHVPVEERHRGLCDRAGLRGDPQDPGRRASPPRSWRRPRAASSRPSRPASTRRPAPWRSSPRTSTPAAILDTGRPTGSASGR